MEIKYILSIILLCPLLFSCGNIPERENTEIKVIRTLKDSLTKLKRPTSNLDVRKIVTRNVIDNVEIPLLLVELPTGQNGTLTQYPNQGIGQTWLGIDGATITLEKGVLIASRGMGEDIMGGESMMPDWHQLNLFSNYNRTINYLVADNQIQTEELQCSIKKTDQNKRLNIFDHFFITTVYNEVCKNQNMSFKNTFFVQDSGLVRKSIQFHSEKIGYISIERLDR